MATATTSASPGMTTAVNALTTPTGGTTTQGIAPYAADYVSGMLSGAASVATEPYQMYSGPLTAGPSAIQNKMFEGIGGLSLPQNFGASFTSSSTPAAPQVLGTGLSTTAGTSTPMSGLTSTPGTTGTGIASQYMNPYLQSVLNPQLQSLRENAQSNMNAQLGKLTSQGAYGGGRQAVMMNAANTDLLQELNKTIGAGYASAYDKGLAQFNKEQEQGRGIYDLMSTMGKTQRDIEQEGITADFKEFERQRDYPREQIKFLKETLGPGMLPLTQTETSSAQLGTLAQLLGAAGGAAELKKSLDELGISGSDIGSWLSDKLGFGG